MKPGPSPGQSALCRVLQGHCRPGGMAGGHAWPWGSPARAALASVQGPRHLFPEGWALSSSPSGEDQRLLDSTFPAALLLRVPCLGRARGKRPFLAPSCPAVVFPAEKAEGPGQLIGVDDGERAAGREGPRGLGRKHLHIDVGVCKPRCRQVRGRDGCPRSQTSACLDGLPEAQPVGGVTTKLVQARSVCWLWGAEGVAENPAETA